MKNLKNTLTATALTAVLGMGTISANAGILISDRSSNNGCNTSSQVLNQLAGILIVGAPMLDSIILVGRDGILISDKSSGCSSKDGIILVGRDGILISD